MDKDKKVYCDLYGHDTFFVGFATVDRLEAMICSCGRAELKIVEYETDFYTSLKSYLLECDSCGGNYSARERKNR